MSKTPNDPLRENESDARYQALLDCARDLAERIFAPRANQTDQGETLPFDNIRLLGEAGLLGLTVPTRYGGHGAPGSVLREYTEILAAACGVTTFVQGQHLSACLQIAGGQNEGLKETLLPILATGKRLCGVAFSHLRRPGPPVMRVEEDGDDFVFNGAAPWVTGWGLMEEVMLGGTLPDGRMVYVITPLGENEAMQASAPMRLCAMNASGTVSLTCRNLRVGSDRLMKLVPREHMAVHDLSAILAVTAQPFGVTTASIRLLNALAKTRHNALLSETADTLERELAAVRRAADEWRDCTAVEGYKERALRIRAWCIELGVRAAYSAVAASGGGANDRDHTAQRLYREAMLYTLIAQTRDVQTATLERLNERSARTNA